MSQVENDGDDNDDDVGGEGGGGGGGRGLKVSAGRRQTSWLFASFSGHQETTSTRDQSGT